MSQTVFSSNHSLLEILENATLAKPCVFLIKICKITTRTTWVKLYCSLFKVFKRCARKKWNKSWIQLFQPLKRTVENCLKGQYGSNHIVLASPHLGFRKSGECWILKDVMVQLRTIRFTVFRWTIQFVGTIRVGTLSLNNLIFLIMHKSFDLLFYKFLLHDYQKRVYYQ